MYIHKCKSYKTLALVIFTYFFPSRITMTYLPKRLHYVSKWLYQETIFCSSLHFSYRFVWPFKMDFFFLYVLTVEKAWARLQVAWAEILYLYEKDFYFRWSWGERERPMQREKKTDNMVSMSTTWSSFLFASLLGKWIVL